MPLETRNPPAGNQGVQAADIKADIRYANGMSPNGSPATLTLPDLLDLLGYRDDEYVQLAFKPDGQFAAVVVRRLDVDSVTVPQDRDVWFGVCRWCSTRRGSAPTSPT